MSDILTLAKTATMNAAERICKDTSYIQNEMLSWKPMDHGKSTMQILAECTKVNRSIASAIVGKKPENVEEADFETLKELLMKSAEDVCNSIDSITESGLEGDPIQLPWGTTLSPMEAIFLPSNHMVYHDGQINYIQTLLGDTKFHWAEE